MSIKKAAKIANAFVGDGIRQSTARELGRKGRSRDFWRWMKLPFDPYPVELPLNKSGLDPHVVMENTNFVLPSDMLAEMLRQNVRLVFLTSTLDICVFGPEGHTSLATYWAKECADFMQKIKLNQADAAFAIPLFLHEDGVPSFKDESYSFWSWSSLSRHQSAYSRAFVVGLPSSRVLPSTRATICDVLAWDLANLAKGVRPTHDHRGRVLTGNRAKLAGKAICGGYTAHFAWWKGDMEARVSAHNLMTRHYRCKLICDLCLATADRRLSYGDFSSSALWRQLQGGVSDEADQSHWLPVPGYSRSRILLDSMHLLNLGTMRDIIASALTSWLLLGILQKHLGTGYNEVNKALHRFTYLGKQWAKTVGEELNIKDELTRAKIGMPTSGMVLKQYPELDSRIKDQCDASTALFKLHLDAYQFLALDSLAKGRLLWHLRPKFHYSDHLLQWSKSSKMNPQAVSNFMDEDHMKFMSRTGARIHIMFSILVLLMTVCPGTQG
ncbi:unnamed protein product [Symbiodinium sp. KB8]|nr:unnamed protein product [Symbiodinium sp. KB8]